MNQDELLQILKNIESTLKYEDWVHAREYVRLEIKKIEENKKA